MEHKQSFVEFKAETTALKSWLDVLGPEVTGLKCKFESTAEFPPLLKSESHVIFWLAQPLTNEAFVWVNVTFQMCRMLLKALHDGCNEGDQFEGSERFMRDRCNTSIVYVFIVFHNNTIFLQLLLVRQKVG